MSAVSYAPGDGHAVVRPDLCVMLPHGGADLAGELWRRCREADDAVTAALDVLCGEGFAALPDFVCLWQEDRMLRAICRGDTPVEIRQGEVVATWSGADTRSWREYSCPMRTDLRAAVGVVEGQPGLLPLGGGVIGASMVEVGFAADSVARGSDRPSGSPADTGDNEFAHLFGAGGAGSAAFGAIAE